MKRLTGEVEMFDVYVDSLAKLYLQIPKVKTSAVKEMSSIKKNLQESLGYIRNIVQDTGMNVT